MGFGRGLGGSWASLGRSWAALGRSWASLGRFLGASWVLLGASWLPDAAQEVLQSDFGRVWGGFWEGLGKVLGGVWSSLLLFFAFSCLLLLSLAELEKHIFGT